jgi:hypothetical protein
VVEDTGQIRQAIEATRADIAETMEALGQKADVKTRVTHGLKEKAEEVRAQVSASADQVRSGERWPDPAARVALAAGLAMMFLVVMVRRRHRR